MLEIQNIDANNLDFVKNFLLRVKSVEELDENILKNGLMVKDDDIIGIISYEVFISYGLIRYFVFKKDTDELIVKELIDELSKKARNNGLTHLFSIVNNKDLENLFISFDFYKEDLKDVYIEEVSFLESEFKDANLLIKDLSI